MYVIYRRVAYFLDDVQDIGRELFRAVGADTQVESVGMIVALERLGNSENRVRRRLLNGFEFRCHGE